MIVLHVDLQIAIPTFLDKPPTGILHYDLVPIISMLACMPTLLLFARRKRYADFVGDIFLTWPAMSHATAHFLLIGTILEYTHCIEHRGRPT